MIRINLLPVKAARRRELGQRQIYVAALVVVLTCAALFVVHQLHAGTVDEIKKDNARVSAAIEELKQAVGDFDKLKAEREQLVAQRDVIENLKAARSGPVFVMRELARLLTPGGQPTMDTSAYEECVRKDPNCAYNPRWDPRRVAVMDWKEVGKHLDLVGAAKDNADVAEFLKRMSLSQYFADVSLTRTDAALQSEAAAGVKHVKFALSATIRYDVKGGK